jgi:ABC transporter substrate binding protein
MAFGSRLGLNQPRLDHIVGTPEDRNRCCRQLCSANCSISEGINDIDLGFDEVRRILPSEFTVTSKLATFSREVSSLNEAKTFHLVIKSGAWRSLPAIRGKDAKAIGPPRFLRERCERPCDNRAHKRDELCAAASPAIYQSPELAEEGGLIGYGPRFVQVFRDVMARQLAQLFRGTKVADIPVEQPTKFELVINLKTANAIGVTVPATLVARADKVIE